MEKSSQSTKPFVVTANTGNGNAICNGGGKNSGVDVSDSSAVVVVVV